MESFDNYHYLSFGWRRTTKPISIDFTTYRGEHEISKKNNNNNKRSKTNCLFAKWNIIQLSYVRCFPRSFHFHRKNPFVRPISFRYMPKSNRHLSIFLVRSIFHGVSVVCIYKIEFCIQKRCETHVLNKRARVFRDSILCTSMHGVCYSHRLYIRHRWSIFQYTRNVHVICDILHSTTDTMHERMCVGKRPKRAMCSFLYEEFHLADLPCVSPIWIAYKTFELSDDLWTQNIFKWFGNLPDIYTMHRCAWELTPPPSPLEL